MNNISIYTKKDLYKAYEQLGVNRGKVVYLTADLSYLGIYEKKDKLETLKVHYNTIKELLGEEGTVVVATSSPSLVNTDIPFDIHNTPSEMGILTEYIRKQNGAIRSMHPFNSYTAVGKLAEEICKNNSRHAYGPLSPEDKMVKLDTLAISIGLHPRFTCSTVHHCEMIMGVPYRYNKEFLHPIVKNNNKIVYEKFYRNVWYRECNIKRDQNKKIFEKFAKGNLLKKVKVGRGNIYSYSLKIFVNEVCNYMAKDIYIWLKEEPKIKPYCK